MAMNEQQPDGFTGTPGRRYFERAKQGGDNMKLNVFTPDNYEELLALPPGTEVALFALVGPTDSPFAIGGTIIKVDDNFYEETRRRMRDGDSFPFQFAVYVLPENLAPDNADDTSNPSQTGH